MMVIQATVMVEDLELSHRMIMPVPEVKVMVAVTGSIWELLAKHLDDISVILLWKFNRTAGSSRNGARHYTAKCSAMQRVTSFAF